jgi:hypothetical protein
MRRLLATASIGALLAAALASTVQAGVVFSGSPPHSPVVAQGSSPATFAGPGVSGQCLRSAGSTADPTWGTCSGSGGVASVSLTLPTLQFTCTGNPITGSGTIDCEWNDENANLVLAGPASGSPGTPAFRGLVAADIPALPYVSSVALAAPAEFTVSGSPITGAGTLTLTKATQSPNLVYAGPSSGSPAQPGFRNLVLADLPSGLPNGTVTSVALAPPSSIITVSGSPITTSGTLTESLVSQVANFVWAGPTTGSAAAPAFRGLVAADIPSLSYVTSVGLSLPGIFTVSGSPVTAAGTLSATLNAELANTMWAGPVSGGSSTPAFRALVAADIPTLSYVASVALAAPPEFTVSGSPVTGSGTLTFAKNSQTANLVYAGPTSGGVAAPTFRSLVAADLPGGVGSVTSVAQTVPAEFSVSGSPITGAGTLAISKVNEATNSVWAGPATGGSAAPAFRALVAADIPSLPYGTGTVTSVSLSLPTQFSCSGSPVTTSGGFTCGWTSAAQNSVLAGPASGGAGIPAFRSLAASDIPALSYVTSVGLVLPTAVFSISGSPVTSSGNLTAALQTQLANTIWGGPISGAAATPAFRSLVAADIPALSYVTRVAQAVPAEFTIGGSPITGAGTLTIGKATETANTVWAGPTSGAAAQPAFRGLTAADIPSLSYVTSVALAAPPEFTVSGSPVTGSGTLTLTKATQSANLVYAGPATGVATAPTFRALATADLPAGVGTVTSVALSPPSSIITTTGSPITTSGTFTESLVTQAANTVFAGATSGGSTTPAFRAIVSADINPALTTPGPIGGTTPGSGSFSTLGATLFSGSGASLTNLPAGQLTGTILAAQMPALTGDVTSSAGTVATTVAKIAGVAVGTPTGTGNVAFSNSPTFVTPTLGAASATTINKVAVTAPATSATLTIANGATLSAPATASVSGTNTGDQTITLTGGVTGSGTGSFATTVASVPASALPHPTPTTLGGIESLAAVTSNWINAISTAGVPSATQPAFTDISGTATAAQGGTGVASPTIHDVPIAEGASAFNLVGLASGQLLIGQASADPAAKTMSGDATLASGGALTVSTLAGVAPGAFFHGTAATNLTGVVPAANGGAGAVTGALKGNGSGLVTQAASSDLSDTVASTSITPTFDFATHGDLVFTYTTQTGKYTTGASGQVCFYGSIAGTPVYTTASGVIHLGLGAAPNPTTSNVFSATLAQLSTTTWSTGATMVTVVYNGSGIWLVRGLTPGSSGTGFAAAQVPSGTPVIFIWSGCYF